MEKNETTIGGGMGGFYSFEVGIVIWKIGQWMDNHPVWKRGILIAIFSILITGMIGIGSIGFYSVRAARYDMAKVADFGTSMQVLDKKGQLLGAISPQGRLLISGADISDTVKQALIATEDSRFYSHGGFDLSGIFRAAVVNLANGGIEQGASTITQQLARNTYQLGGRSISRKLLEIFVAVRIERHYSKEEILTHYFNRIYFGSGCHGLGSAARCYFGKHPLDLTINEAATLVGVIRSPNAFSPLNNPEKSRRARDHVLSRMVEQGYLGSARAEQIVERGEIPVESSDDMLRRPIFLLSEIKAEAIRRLGGHPGGNVTIISSIDSSLQLHCEEVVAAHLSRIESSDQYRDFNDGPASRQSLQGCAIVIENRTGRIAAAVPSRDQMRSHFDRISLNRRPAGIAFLPFVFAAGIEKGAFHLGGKVIDAPIDNRKVMLGGTSGILGEWSTEDPKTRYYGMIPASLAFVEGKNAASLRVGSRVGVAEVKRFARAAGIESPLSDFPSTLLGGSGVNLAELTHAYTIFPNRGFRSSDKTYIDAIISDGGKILYSSKQSRGEPLPVLSDETAWDLSALMTSALKRAVGKSGAKLKGLDGGRLENCGAMPGTSCDYHDNWFVGFDENYSWGVWVGRDYPAPIYHRAFSKDTALPIWAEIGQSLSAGESMLVTSDGFENQNQVILRNVSDTLSSTRNAILTIAEPETKRPGKSGNGFRSVTPTMNVVINPDPY